MRSESSSTSFTTRDRPKFCQLHSGTAPFGLRGRTKKMAGGAICPFGHLWRCQPRNHFTELSFARKRLWTPYPVRILNPSEREPLLSRLLYRSMNSSISLVLVVPLLIVLVAGIVLGCVNHFGLDCAGMSSDRSVGEPSLWYNVMAVVRQRRTFACTYIICV